jgi:hypothetical protein
MAAVTFDYLAAEQDRVWLGDCKITGQTLTFCYGFFAKNTPAKVTVWREDGKGYLVQLPPELTLQPFPINFFKRVEFEILDVATKKEN